MLQDTPDASMGPAVPPLERAPAPETAAAALTTCAPCDPRRAEVERYVRRAFRRVHCASVCSLPTTLLTLRGRDGQLSAVVGCRAAGAERLYLERYLDVPIETALAMRLGLASVPRASIVEIGSLACSGSLAAQRLLRRLPPWLRAQGYAWAVFTATRRVRELLRIFDAPLLELCRASAERVAGSGDDWGHYYQSDPRVLAGFLPDAEGAR